MLKKLIISIYLQVYISSIFCTFEVSNVYKIYKYFQTIETPSLKSKMVKSISYKKKSIECLFECNNFQNCSLVSLPFKTSNLCNLYENELVVKLNKSDEAVYFFKKNIEQKSEIIPWIEYYECIGHQTAVTSLAQVSNESLISGARGEIKIWNPYDAKLIQTLNTGVSENVRSMAVLKNGDLAASCGNFSGNFSIKIFNLTNGGVYMILTGHQNDIYSMVVLNNGNLVSASLDGKIKIWNITNGTEIITLSGHFGSVYSLVLLDNGDLVSGSSDRSIIIWSNVTFNIKRTISLAHSDIIRSLTKLKNNQFASGSSDKNIKIWNSTNGALIKTLIGNTDRVMSLALLSNGLLVSGCWDNLLNIWNISTGTLIKSLNEHTGPISTLIVLDNQDLASGSNDKTIKIWKISN